MDPEEKDKILREMVRHEDTLRDDRLSYLLTLNGFLFASLAFAWRRNGEEATALVVLLAIVGLAVGISAFAAQRMSNKAVRKLRTLGSSGSPPVVGLSGEEPKCDPAHVSTLTDALAPWHALPWLLIVIWPAIAVVRFIYD